MNSPKILITHASAGSGHTKAAEAVYSYLKAHFPEAGVTFLNVLDKTNGIFKAGYVQGYNFLVNSFPELWGAGFAVSSSALFKKTVKLINNSVELINSGSFLEFLKAENFDVIVSAHFLSSWAAA
ncbi:MAG: hypothetical protein PHE58_07295, partial [Candidatus Omnitrophica bacterium]|nr:hypothetical protein [Candidatus Omnitrophota bacterium]